jgi:hypothetical protein
MSSDLDQRPPSGGPGRHRGRAVSLAAISGAVVVVVGLALVLLAVVVLQPGAAKPSGFATAPIAGPGVVEHHDAIRQLAWSGKTPARLALPTLHVQAAIRPVVTTSGVLGIPDDPAQVGWWTGSVTPGAPTGSVVLDGHVDSATRGLGALFLLSQLQAGDPVTVSASDGTSTSYRIYARQVYGKQRPLPADLFDTAGASRLVLITCGGPFNHATRSYRDNIVVLAAPQV